MESSLKLARDINSFLLAKAVVDEMAGTTLAGFSYTEHGFYIDFDFLQTEPTEILFDKLTKRMLSLIEVSDASIFDTEFSFFDGNVGKLPLDSKDFSLAKHFKLHSLSGAYWQGDARNKMVKRIQCDCFLTDKDLQEHLKHQEELLKRDHRHLGKVMDLFHIEEFSPGMAFWHNNGMIIFNSLIKYMQSKLKKYGYEEIRTPLILDRALWEKSGHWEKFKENMFSTHSENRDYCVKPMNCPGCVMAFNHYMHSYRDLPARMAEFGIVHRNESSGSLHGLMRVRCFTQDDAHIFCTEEQFLDEIIGCMKFIQEVYGDFGFDDLLIKISTRPEQSIGTAEVWERAEGSLKMALEKLGLEYEILPGEGAFYGPKIEISLKDVLGRIWQCGTVQVDFFMPERLGASYISPDNSKIVPIMIHRAILGSVERFVAIILENSEGKLPFWLTPIQVVVMNISEKQAKYAREIVDLLERNDIRAKLDTRAEKVGYKIREAINKKIPIQIIVGDKEKEAGTISVRINNEEKSMKVEEFLVLSAKMLSISHKN